MKKREMNITIIKAKGNDFRSIPLKGHEFPTVCKKFHSGVGAAADAKTMAIEEVGAGLVEDNDFSDAGRVGDFVRQIYNWGGGRGPGLFSQLQQEYSDNTIAQIVGEAAALLRGGNLEAAFDKITSLHGLGASYGSAILRMLSPQQAAMGAYAHKQDGDNIKLSSWSNITAANYAGFCKFCKTGIIDKLKKEGAKNPCRENGEWFVADIEAVICYREREHA